MNWSELLEGNGIVAWGVAFLLAVGGTAVVVAAWLQFRNTWRRLPRAWSRKRTVPAQARPAAPPERPAVDAPSPQRAVEVYRDQAQAPRAVRPASVERSAPTTPALDPQKLNAYLDRLHQAVDELELVATAGPAGS